MPAAVFDGVDYVALGHLHRPQTLTPRLRYSGSPLAYSFGEAGPAEAGLAGRPRRRGLAEVRPVPLPAPRRLAVLTGELDELLADPAHAGVEEHFVSVRLTDAVRPGRPDAPAAARFPHCVHLEWAGRGAPADGRSYPERLRGRTDLEVAGEFVEPRPRLPATRRRAGAARPGARPPPAARRCDA